LVWIEYSLTLWIGLAFIGVVFSLLAIPFEMVGESKKKKKKK
jgi:hypothetical protein